MPPFRHMLHVLEIRISSKNYGAIKEKQSLNLIYFKAARYIENPGNFQDYRKLVWLFKRV